jgi:hypothetical protein
MTTLGILGVPGSWGVLRLGVPELEEGPGCVASGERVCEVSVG